MRLPPMQLRPARALVLALQRALHKGSVYESAWPGLHRVVLVLPSPLNLKQAPYAA